MLEFVIAWVPLGGETPLEKFVVFMSETLHNAHFGCMRRNYGIE